MPCVFASGNPITFNGTQMHISNIAEVSNLHQALVEVDFEISVIEDSLAVSIQGRRQNEELIAKVRPAVLAVLNERRKKIEQELSYLGVKFD